MRCNGSFGEGYSLYVLGTAEVAERLEIQSHVDAGCETCVAAVKANLQLWSGFSAAISPSDAVPPASLRKRILDAIAGSGVIPMRRSGWSFLGAPLWKHPAAAVLLLAAGAGLGWFGAHYGGLPKTAPEQTASRPSVTPPESGQETARLQARVEELQNSLNAAAAKLAEAEKSAAGQTRETENGKRMLAAAQAELQRTTGLLSDASTKLTQAQAELQQNQAALAGIQKARQEADDRLRAALQDRAQVAKERDQLAERERALAAQNRDLRQQVAGYQAVVDKQSNQAAPLLRLAGMLNSPSLRFLRLQGTGAHGGVTGSAFVTEGSGVLVYASGLPALPKGRTYQLWLMRRQSPGIVSGGVFKPDSNGRAFIEVDPSLLTRGVATVSVTDEPDGGSPGPTGTKFLIGVSS